MKIKSEINVRTLARKITNELFVNGSGENADRLVLVKGTRDLGGWGVLAACSRIEAIVRRELSERVKRRPNA